MKLRSSWRADVFVTDARAVGRSTAITPANTAGPDIAEVEGRRADFGEAQRRQVDLASDLGEAPGCDLVDLEAREAFHLAVALLRPVIDIVVAERAEVISRERVQRSPQPMPPMGVDPEGAVGERQRDAVVDAAIDLRESSPASTS